VVAEVTLKGAGNRVRAAIVLDPSGRELRRLEPRTDGADCVITLAADSLYTIVELAGP
jgi:hypothetical protein